MASRQTDDCPPQRLREHWASWLGADDGDVAVLGEPGVRGSVRVVGSPLRQAPAWDGLEHRVAGVVDPAGNAVVSLPPQHAGWAQERLAAGHDLAALRRELPVRLGVPDEVAYQAVYRWSVAVPSLEPVGCWLDVGHAEVPAWLRPFGGEVLVVLDPDAAEGERYLAGVGLKRHDDLVHEIAVGTTERARGRGLARRLVVTAALELMAQGRVPTYLHASDNAASARVADAAGFPDRGWHALGIARPE